MEGRFLILETSCQVGQVALGLGEQMLAIRRLDEARHHARDLAPAIRDLLTERGWKARDLNAIMASRGPGSYTGLRVGLMTAKTMAYATGCALLALDTFAAIACQVSERAEMVDVLGDAQQDRVYVQRFARVPADDAGPPRWQPQAALAIRPFADWLTSRGHKVWVTGPGVRKYEDRLKGHPVVESGLREPLAASLLQLGLQRFRRGERDDFWKLEPLYLRPSAAEEKWLERTSPC